MIGAMPTAPCDRCGELRAILLTGDDSRGPRTVCPPCWTEINPAPAAPLTLASRTARWVRPAEPAPEHLQMALDGAERRAAR
jgi:hypothetical protein